MPTRPEEILEEIADDFNQWLKSGVLNINQFYTDPNLNIDNIERLLRIHFILRTDGNGRSTVLKFIEDLPPRLRRIRTTIKPETELLSGEVKGRIKWNDTIRHRYNRNPEDETLFSCDLRERDYDIPENLVLKELLGIIHKIIAEDLKVYFDEEATWFEEWTKDKELRNTVGQLFLRNIYLKRIGAKKLGATKKIVNDRMISRAQNSRSELYKEAASLLSQYRRIMNYELDKEDAEELLRNTFIKPERDYVLFELYWTIRIVREFRKRFNDLALQLVEPGSHVVARWDSSDKEYTFTIYHNSTGGSFEFRESVEELQKVLPESNRDNYLGRELAILEKFNEMLGKKDGLWGRRPDILLEKRSNTGELQWVLLGEVKYTDDVGYAQEGLKQLLEYMALIRHKGGCGHYIEPYKNLFEELVNVYGILFLDNIKEADFKATDRIQVVKYGQEQEIKIPT